MRAADGRQDRGALTSDDAGLTRYERGRGADGGGREEGQLAEEATSHVCKPLEVVERAIRAAQAIPTSRDRRHERSRRRVSAEPDRPFRMVLRRLEDTGAAPTCSQHQGGIARLLSRSADRWTAKAFPSPIR
jgi:hypothetical protein